MFEILLIVGGLVVALFVLTVLFGAPFVPTHASAVGQALDLLNLPKNSLLIELGSGDGRLLKAAAERGLRAVGYEINPLLWLIGRIRTWKYRRSVQLKLASYKNAAWPKGARGIYIFGTHRDLKFLQRKLQNYKARPLTVVSYGFKLLGLKPAGQQGALVKYEIK